MFVVLENQLRFGVWKSVGNYIKVLVRWEILWVLLSIKEVSFIVVVVVFGYWYVGIFYYLEVIIWRLLYCYYDYFFFKVDSILITRISYGGSFYCRFMWLILIGGVQVIYWVFVIR